MSKGTLGPSDMALRPGRDYPMGGQPGFGIDTMELKYPQFGQPGFGNIFGPQPGYQQPQPNQPQQPNQGQQQQQQYFQQMHKNMDGMNEALKQIESMKMPGQQYGGGYNPGNFFGKGATLF